MGIGLNGMNGTFQAWGTPGIDSFLGGQDDEPKVKDAQTFGTTPKNSIEEMVSAEVENDITHYDDVSREFAAYKYPVPELRVEEMSAHGL